MAKIDRKTFVQFGSSGAATFFGQFGSKEAGVPQTTKDPTVIQQLAAWVDGWQEAIASGDKAAYYEDMNGLCYVYSYMLAYLFQQGIPEWDSGTTYFTNSIVQDNVGTGQWFKSLQDNNVNNTPPPSASNSFWEWINPPQATIPDVGNGLLSGLSIAPNTGAPNNKLDVAANTISVQGVALASVAVSPDINVSGANGLDTGSETPDTWYAVHLITNASGSLIAGLFSLSATSPTLPGGYTKFRRIGWVRNNSSGNFVSAKQFGARVRYYAPPSIQVSASGTVSFATAVPSTVFTMETTVDVGTPGGTAGSELVVQYRANLTGSSNITIVDNWIAFNGFTFGSGAGSLLLGPAQDAIITHSNCPNSYWQITGYEDTI